MESSWLHGLIGGTLIGAASLLAASVSGKIPGISGIFEKAILPRGDAAWRWLFVAGLILGAALAFRFFPPAAVFQPVSPLWIHVVAGLFVGFGTRLGGGCTSGHGICGIGLGARDSMIATLIFMATAMLTVWFGALTSLHQ